MRCGGYLEGALTADRIYQSFRSFYEYSLTNTTTLKIVAKFAHVSSFILQANAFQDNALWIRQQVKLTQQTVTYLKVLYFQNDPYWRQISLVLFQFEGLLVIPPFNIFLNIFRRVIMTSPHPAT